MLLEIACFNLESVIIAQANGADRIELCENYEEGGVTPSKEIILEAKKNCSLPIHVIIRPSSNTFVYSDSELQQMRESILFCKENKVEGVVFGVLTQNFETNESVCLELISLARPMSVTFHRAFDSFDDQKKEIKKLIKLGFDRVLTSAGEISALKGAHKLKELRQEFGSQIIIMPGGGIRSGNLEEIISITGCTEFHSAAMPVGRNFLWGQEVKWLKEILG